MISIESVRDQMVVNMSSGGSRIEYDEGYKPRRKEGLEIPGLVTAAELKRQDAGPYKSIERPSRGESGKWSVLLRELPLGMCLEMEKGVSAARSIVGRFRRKDGGSFEVRAHGDGSRVWRVK